MMTRKANSNTKSLDKENDYLKEKNLKDEFGRIATALKSHNSSRGGHKQHPEIEQVQAEADFLSRNNALKTNILLLVTTYNPGVPKLKEILMKNWSLITSNPNLARLLRNAPIVAYRKHKSVKYLLVGAKIPPQP